MDSVTQSIHPSAEITRLQDLLPASWRMGTVISQRPDQTQTITSTALLPWNNTTQVRINFRLWSSLAVNQRDLFFLQEVAWRQQANWLQWGTYQLVGLFAGVGTVWETIEGDVTGMAVAILLVAIAAKQIDRKHNSIQIYLESDGEAIRVAQRRGYTETIAARSLLEALQSVAKLEGRLVPGFMELIRCQNLRVLAGSSKVEVPSDLD